jgi:ABC-2 type transport system permease protein
MEAMAEAPMSMAEGAIPHVGRSVDQVFKLTRYQLREYLRSKRFIALLAIILTIDVILTTVIAYYRSSFVAPGAAGALSFYSGAFGGGAAVIVVLCAVFFGGDAIAGEFQNKTGYFLMGLPLRRTTIFIAKFIAAFAASIAILLVDLLAVLGNGVVYYGVNAFPWQVGVSLLLTIIYLLAVLGTTFLFSSLFKTSSYGYVLTAILFLFGFTILQELVANLIGWEPWMVISYANSLGGGVVGNVFQLTVTTGVNPVTHQPTTVPMPWGLHGIHYTAASFGGTTTVYVPGIAEGVVIMLGYFIITSLAGLWMFEREEFS